jgi:hypothetical protein
MGNMETKDKSSRGQATVELIALMAGALIILLMVIVILPEQYSGIGLEKSRQDGQAAANMISATADEVYLAGDGAQKTEWVDFPQGYDYNKSFLGNRLAGGTIYENRTVGIYLIGIGQLISEGKAPICGALPNESGRYRLTFYYNSSGHVMVNSTC